MTPFHVRQAITGFPSLPLLIPLKRREDSIVWILRETSVSTLIVPGTIGWTVNSYVVFPGTTKGKVVYKRTISRWIVLCINICCAPLKKQPPEGLRVRSIWAKAATTSVAPGVHEALLSLKSDPSGWAFCPFGPAGFFVWVIPQTYHQGRQCFWYLIIRWGNCG